jgi:predicted extracellular nuclease
MSSKFANSNSHTFAFYNIENLFDIYDDELTNDDDFLPTSDKRWTKKRYDRKIYKLGSVIPKIGFVDSNKPPTIIGLAEVENKLVLEDLIESKGLKDHNYGFVHYNSPDERGIDTALLYNKDFFDVESSETFSVYLEDENGERDYTRDILLVSGFINKELVHIIVNHWSSRRGSEESTKHKRLSASNKAIEIISMLKRNYDNPKIVVMGDFNDNPNNESVKLLVNSENLYNPMETLWSNDTGSLSYNFKWNFFDQILFSTNFFEVKKETLSFEKADVFDEKFLTQYKGKYQGQPFRTYVGRKHKGGFSDHFPVYIILK